MNRTIQLYLALLITLLFLMGCSSQRQSSTAASSSAQIYCSPIQSSDITGLIRAGTDSSGNFDPNSVRVQINNLNSAFTSANNSVLQITAWGFQFTGGPTERSSALSFHFETPQGTVLTGDTTSVSASAIAGYVNQGLVSASSIQGFLSQTNIVVSGVGSTQYKALSLTSYAGSQVQFNADGLIPYYDADPNAYGSSHDLTLDQLHPFWSLRSQSNDWSTMAQQLCN